MTPSPHDDDLREETALPDASDLQLVDLDSQLNRQRSPRQRLISIGILTTIVVVALVSLQYAHVLPKGLLGAVPTATPSRQITAPDRHFLPQQVAVFTNAASPIMLNGVPVASQSPIPYTIVTLAKGKNILSVNAPPLTPRTCIISFPANASIDTCQQINDVVGGNFIDLTLGWNSLTPVQQQSATTVISAYIAHLDNSLWHTTIPAGQYYVTGFDPKTGLPLAKAATTTMNAALTIALASPAANGTFADCQYILCPPQFFSSADTTASTMLHWMIQVHAALTWNFTPVTSGSPITVPVIPPVTFNTQTSSVLFTDMQTLALVLTYDPTTGWGILNEDTRGTDQVFQTICEVGNQFVGTAAIAQGLNPIEVSSADQYTIAGCRMRYNLTNTGNTYSLEFVYRFGVLFASNSDARTLFPALPVASTAENAAVPGA